MKKNNKTLKETFDEAVKNFREKKFKDAELICYKILSIDSNHVNTMNLLANISAIHGNFEKSKELMIKAVEIQPQNTALLNNLGNAYKELGKTEEAINIYKKVLKINPNHVNANYNLGSVFYQSKEFITAKNYLQKTVELQNNYALAYLTLANVHVELREQKEAMSCYQKSIEINPNILMAHNNLGLLYRDMNDFSNAINSFQKAINLKSDHANSHHNLALTYREIGDFNKSIKSHEKAVKSEPENLMNDYFLSELKKDVLDSNLKNKVEKILSNEKPTLTNLAYGNYLLAKYERKTKNYEKELNHLIKGHKNFFNTYKKKFELNNKFCFDDVHQIMQGGKIKKTNIKSNVEVKPIFIIGVPRTGTTLVERIVSSGKKLIPIGEETGIIGNYIQKKILEKQSLTLGEDEEVRNELLNIYKDRGLISKKYDYRFTDKSLDNFFYLELINEIYPNAKIINCRRNVLSSIMSIFQNNLTALAWTHDLDNIFKYFDNYFEIIDNYNEINPNSLYELKFEDLMNNPEEESRKLIQFCELPWDKNCLEFHKRKDLFSKTASNIQIRGGIQRNLLNKYSPYKKLLDKYGNKYSWFN